MAKWIRSATPMALGLMIALHPSIAGPSEDFFEALGVLKVTEKVVAPQFELSALDGKTVRLSDYRGKVVLINFWATWCRPCREEMPSMERLYREYKAKGLEILAVSVDIEGAKVVRPFMQELKLTFPAFLDPGFRAARTYGVRGIPVTFIISKQGDVVGLAQGPRQWDKPAASKLIESLLK